MFTVVTQSSELYPLRATTRAMALSTLTNSSESPNTTPKMLSV